MPVRYQLQMLSQPVSFDDIFSHCRKLLSLVTPSEDEKKAIEGMTQKQHSSKRWHEKRYG